MFHNFFHTIWLSRKGSALIGLIVTMVVLSVLGAAMVSLTSTAMFNQVGSNSSARAYLLAESGFRYAESRYLNAGSETARDNELETLHDAPAFTLSHDAGEFDLKVYPYYYRVIENPPIGTATLKTEVPGGFASGLTLPTPGRLKIGPKSSSIFQYSAAVVAGRNVTFTLTNPISSHFPIDMPVYFVAIAVPQTLTSGGSLQLLNDSGDGFPLRNGTFELNGNVYAYKTYDAGGGQLVGVKDPDDPGMPDVILTGNTDIILQKFVKLHSSGKFGQGSVEGAATREVVYHVPLQEPAVTAKREIHETFDDPALTNWQTIIGPHSIRTVGGDSVLRVDINPTPGSIDTSLIAFRWSGTALDLAAAHRDAGNFLSYDVQTKIGFDPEPTLWEFPAGSPFPELYVAGITFRLNTAGNGYGVSFVRGDNNFGWPQDGIPNSLIPTGSIDASVSTGSDDAEERVSDGNMYLDSTDLELINDPVRGDQEVGMRFQNIYIPQGANITDATIEFETDQADAGVTNLIFWAEDIDHAPTFTSGAYNISNRTKTASSVSWAPGPWLIESQKQTTPNLKAIIQEVIDRPGWSSGNSLAIIVTGSGQRTAESYEGEPANAPRLRVQYELNDIPLVMLWQQTAANTWTWLAYKRLPDGFTIPTGDEATLMVRTREAASIEFTNGNDHGVISIEAGDTIVGQFSGASAVVNRRPIVDSGDWGSGTAQGTLLVNNINGVFAPFPELLQVAGSPATADGQFVRDRDNYIQVFFGDVSGNGTANDIPTDDQTIGNPRGVVNWPPDNTEDTTAVNDYLQLVQWDIVNPAVNSDTAYRMGQGKELNTIIRSKTFMTPSAGTFNEPEIGLHTIGNSSPRIYFDDFAVQTETAAGSPPGFIRSIQE